MPIIVGNGFLKYVRESVFSMEFSESQSVIFQKRMKAKIVAVVKDSEKPYGIAYVTPKNKVKTLFTTAAHLSKRKTDKDLVVGDCFKDKNKSTYEVIFRTREEFRNTPVYIAKMIKHSQIDDKPIDYVKKFYPTGVEEILY